MLKRALGIPYVNRIDFFCFLCISKHFTKKLVFVYEWKLRWLPSSKDNAHVYIQKKQKNWERFLYTKRQTHFKKLDNLRYVLYAKIHTLDVTGFSWNFWSWNLHTKSMTLWVTWHFYIQKARYFAKIKTICDTFLYTKIRHFCVTQFFIGFLKFSKGGVIYLKKQCTLCDIFISKKIHFALRCYIHRSWHSALQSNIQKKCTFFMCIYI